MLSARLTELDCFVELPERVIRTSLRRGTFLHRKFNLNRNEALDEGTVMLGTYVDKGL
jgi:hypothetical protein